MIVLSVLKSEGMHIRQFIPISESRQIDPVGEIDQKNAVVFLALIHSKEKNIRVLCFMSNISCLESLFTPDNSIYQRESAARS